MRNDKTVAEAMEEVVEPILYHFPPYGYVRYQCPRDGQPMENQTREFSHFGVGMFRCLGGHWWGHDSDRLWTPAEEAALAQNLVEIGESLAQTGAILDRLEAAIARDNAAEAAYIAGRDKTFDAVESAISTARTHFEAAS